MGKIKTITKRGVKWHYPFLHDKIPLKQNQKVNKKALPIPERKIEEIIEPKIETQQKLFDWINGENKNGTDNEKRRKQCNS